MRPAWRSGIPCLLVVVSAVLAAAPTSRAQSAKPCSHVTEPLLSEAVAEARRYVAERWLQVGENFYVAYRMGSPPANPFDLTRPKEESKATGKAGDKESEEGYIWVGGLQCRVAGMQGEEIALSFTAGATSFIEKNGAWTPPIRQRELTKIVMTRSGTQWIAREERGDHSLLTADDELRRPAPEEVPLRSKRLGIPCDAHQAWNGKRCAAVRSGGR